MTTVDMLLAALTAYAAFWAIYVVVPPLLAAIRGPRAPGPAAGADDELPSIAVLVPAHDMEAVLARCVSALHSCRYPRHRCDVFVIADHCTDATADVAERSGARALRRDDGEPGKTYALAWAIDELARRGIDADIYLITDATARVESEFLHELAAFIARGEDIAVAHSVVDSENQQWFARCLGLTLVHRNLQNWSRERLHLSALIEGRGMAYSRRYIRQYGWSLAVPTATAAGSHPTEDWRHGVQAVEHGMRVAYADAARVLTPLRGSLAAATQQGIRWERGRMANAGTHAVRLFVRAIRQGNLRMTYAALDAMQPPVAILGAVCTLAAIAAVAAPRSPVAAVSAWPLAIVAFYGLAVGARGRRDGIGAATVLWAPVYIAWRCLAFCAAWILPGGRSASRDKKKNGQPTLPTAD